MRRELLSICYALSVSMYVASLGPQLGLPAIYDWQGRLLDSLHKRRIANGARQSGKSTIVSGKACHTARFIPGSLSIVLAADKYQAKEDLEKIKAFMSVDEDYPSIERDSDEAVVLDNGSQIKVVTATPKAARGKTRPRLIIVDEASWVEDRVFRSGVRPMLNNNPNCELLIISTPNGRTGFFWNVWQNERYERYLVRSPWEVDDVAWRVIANPESEQMFQERMAEQGIRAWYSPEHADWENQQEAIEDMGPREYRQEMCCEFVEPEFQVFPYAHIDRAFENQDEDMPMNLIEETDDVEAIEIV